VKLIAEIKRASPSRGLFCQDLVPEQLASTYAINGAAAISVLTDHEFFQGQLGYLERVKSQVTRVAVEDGSTARRGRAIPVMRKDFIFHPYQVYESRAYGADALLLIVAVLKREMLDDLLALTHDLGMTALVEVHNETEAEQARQLSPRLVGINNRNLHDFSVDLATFGRLRRFVPDNAIAVAESGVHSAADVRRLAEMGADAILVGEALVTAPDVAAKVQELASVGTVGTEKPSVKEHRK
jgi:indole-3-glycerol phosphate synthase